MSIRSILGSIKVHWGYTPAQRILVALLEAKDTGLSVPELMKRAHVGSGSVYPILLSMEDSEIVESWWLPKQRFQRYRTRIYKLTQNGINSAEREKG